MSAVWPLVIAALAVTVAFATLTWLASLLRHDASLVDRVWGPMIAAAGLAAVALAAADDPRTVVMLTLVAAWALRLAAYITWRNWGHGEDRRYQSIRARNQPGFWWKSLVYVFLLQAVLAVVVALPMLAAALRPPAAWHPVLDSAGALLALGGLLFEAVADAQMAGFRADPSRRGQVMDRGLWRYSRHPNYFGECCVWWGVGLMAVAAGGAWALASPLLMTVLLLRVSGVTLLEADLRERRPAYRDYVERTSAFVPWPPRRPAVP